MGAGIVEVFARAKCSVVALAESDPAVLLGKSNFEASLSRAIERNKLTAGDAQSIRDSILWTTRMTDISACSLVIEAAPEKLDVKREIFHQLDTHTSEETILATNTSSLSVTDIAQWVLNPSRVFGLHFFNPAPVQNLVELVTTDFSNPRLADQLEQWVQKIGKVSISVPDSPGFIVNRLLLAYLNSAINLSDSGGYTTQEIDASIRSEAGFPMGPFQLLDLIGLDTSLEILRVMFSATGNSKLNPAHGLVKRVAQHHLGRKSGQGFYTYPLADPPSNSLNEERALLIARRLLSDHVRDAQAMVDSGYASSTDIDLAMKLGCGLPYGPSETPRHLLNL